LDISGVADEDLVCITWTERGGPAVDVQGQGEGYGSKLLNRGVSGQLGGSISTEWFEEGIVVSLKIDPARLSA
jgi:two-component sensor histidine kinase